MTALQDFWKSDYMAKYREDPKGLATGETAGFSKAEAAVADKQEANGPALQAQIKVRLAALVGPYKEAVAENGPEAQELKEHFSFITTSAGKGKFDEAAKGLGSLESLLDQRKNPTTPGLGGMDKGQATSAPPPITSSSTTPRPRPPTRTAQALGPIGKAEYDKADELIQRGWNWINEQGQTKIIVVNNTSKDMKIVPGTEERKRKDQTIWVRKPPPRISAGKSDHFIVQTDMTIRGKTRAETSGSVVYKVDGKDETVRASNLHLVWVRKGDRGLDMVDSAVTDTLLGYEVEGHQSDTGEFTFFVREIPVANPKKKETDSKSAAPADTFVLFAKGKSVLKSEANSKLHEFASAYLAAKSTAKIYVYGYASIDGEKDENKNLSYQRAEAVFKHLISEPDKLPPGNIKWEGLETTIDFDPDPKKFEPNRRATISLTPKGAAPAPDTKKEPQAPADPKAKVKQSRDSEDPPTRPVHPHAASRTGA